MAQIVLKQEVVDRISEDQILFGKMADACDVAPITFYRLLKNLLQPIAKACIKHSSKYRPPYQRGIKILTKGLIGRNDGMRKPKIIQVFDTYINAPFLFEVFCYLSIHHYVTWRIRAKLIFYRID